MYGEIFEIIPVMMHVLEAYHIELYVMNGISYELCQYPPDSIQILASLRSVITPRRLVPSDILCTENDNISLDLR